MKFTPELLHCCPWILYLSTALSLLAALLQEKTGYSLIDIDNLDADTDIVDSCLSIISLSETASHSHKYNLKEPSQYDRLALTSLNRIGAVGKALDRDAVFILLTDRMRRLKKLKWETVLA
jgi:hypothetical protein